MAQADRQTNRQVDTVLAFENAVVAFENGVWLLKTEVWLLER
jgi:hypothetical protein